MKRKMIFIITFAVALLSGYMSVRLFLPAIPTPPPPSSSPVQEVFKPIVVEPSSEPSDTGIEWQEEDPTKFTIKLQETGEGFHGDEVNAKNNETWLGLFNKNG